jgi:hypothetical protein
MSGPVVHGLSAYTTGSCRCGVCRAAFASWFRQRRQYLHDQPLPSAVAHGTLNAYQYYSCRCGQCRAASARYSREYRARRKAAAP